jgi:hypothetical protein
MGRCSPLHMAWRRSSARSRGAPLLIDYEEDRILRAVLVVMLREGDRYT